MPATEQTWRDSKLLHLVFGISALLMLWTTIWMLAADHRREWKDYQRKFQKIEAWTTTARINQLESAQYHDELKEAREAYEATQRAVPDQGLIDRFEHTIDEELKAQKKEPNFASLDATYKALARASDEDKPAARAKLLDEMNQYVTQARFRENIAASEKKFAAADFDVARSEYELGVGNALSRAQLDAIEEKVQHVQEQVDRATAKLQDNMMYRKRLEAIVATITAEETVAKKTLDDQTGRLTQLQTALYDRENHVMKEVTELPILDAFGRPIKIDQIWLPKLTLNNNFSDVARFDRCTTCHQGIDKTAPGSAIEPGYDQQHQMTILLATPSAAPESLSQQAEGESKAKHYARVLEEIYGLQLANEGLLDSDDVTISVVRPETAAAKAELIVGDVIEMIGGTKILGLPMAFNFLLESVEWGKPLKLTVRRGLPNPYASHPRLDLFVGSLSPHKLQDIGCTICHEGQGSATAFKWASHSPNDPFVATRWGREYGWFDNHHWIFPMYPRRFAESSCLKCHHDVTELEPSERFHEPPAPKLVQGFRTIQQVGCFGCHEINGWDGPSKRIGPDLRVEPNYSAAAQAILAGGGLSDPEKTWAADVAADPTNNSARHSLADALKNAETMPGDPSVTKRLVAVLDDVEAPGKLRKVGPSLRHVGSKLDFNFLYSWIRQPSDFRPSTKMPQFFGITDQLDHDSLELSERFEPIEIRGVTEYLMAKSQPFEYATPAKGTAQPSAERGKVAFEVRCLACHQHNDFPAGKMDQGPDLSRIGAKLGGNSNPNGPRWLYTWLRNPSNYHPRTLMPNLLLDPVPGVDGKLTDPAADIAKFLLGSNEGDWSAKDLPARQLTDREHESLFDLALDHLKNVFPRKQAEGYLNTGIPESRASEIKGDEVELLGEMSSDKMLRYVGRRTISKYGCSGCHDVPGFEDAKPIGTGLADWARKTPDKLAFEQIVEFMKKGHGKPGRWQPIPEGEKNITDQQIEEAEHEGHFNFENMSPDEGYFMEKLVGHQREGFIWQKLREPRSYDYQKTQNKGYNERLRMPQFTVLDDAKRESIITFVMGLVAEPPAAQYVYRPSPRRDAIVQGLQVIEKFNCTGCHTLEMEQWKVAYEPDDFADPPEIPDFSFLQVHFSPQQVKASLENDARGLRHATLVGMPAVDEEGKPVRLDEDGAPIDADDTETKAFFPFVPWESVLINGQARQAGLQNILVPESRIEHRSAPVGGSLARLAYPTVVAEEKKVNSNAKPDEAWGWLPPPLVGEGRKVQTAWLHDFLLDPYPIRPAVVLRMPKFNMSSAEATKLANYFAAVDGVDYPYDFDPRTSASHLAAEDATHPDRLNDALKIITDNNFCIKCHLLGDFNPTGSERAKAPRLDQVYKRLRPNFALSWIGNPKRILPYTGMPVNVPFDKPVSQSLYKGDSDQQLNAMVDLLLNYDRYTDSKTPIKPLIKPAPPQAAVDAPSGLQAAGGDTAAGGSSTQEGSR